MVKEKATNTASMAGGCSPDSTDTVDDLGLGAYGPLHEELSMNAPREGTDESMGGTGAVGAIQFMAAVAVDDGAAAAAAVAAAVVNSHPRINPGRRRPHPTTATARRLSLALIIVGLSRIITVLAQASGGYLTSPPSRNYFAFTSNSLQPSAQQPLSSLPQVEPTPQSLNGGTGGGGTCGSSGSGASGERNYDSPKSRADTLMPLNVQAIYASGGEVEVKVELFSEDAGGHFEFSLCPLQYPEVPSEECFSRYPLEFVRDEYYGAARDENYPNRAYVPYSAAFQNPHGGVNGGGALKRVGSGQPGPGGSQMMEFSYTFRLPDSPELGTDFGVLESRGVPTGDVGGTNHRGSTYSEPMSMAQQFLDRTDHLPGRDDDRRLQNVHKKGNNQNQQQGHQGQQAEDEPKLYIATQQGTTYTPSNEETVIISAVSTDGDGTTTIQTLNGQKTVIEGGPKVGQSSTITYGSKSIYGKGIPLKDLPKFVQEELKANGYGSPGNGGGNNGGGSVGDSAVQGGKISPMAGGAGGNGVGAGSASGSTAQDNTRPSRGPEFHGDGTGMAGAFAAGTGNGPSYGNGYPSYGNGYPSSGYPNYGNGPAHNDIHWAAGINPSYGSGYPSAGYPSYGNGYPSTGNPANGNGYDYGAGAVPGANTNGAGIGVPISATWPNASPNGNDPSTGTAVYYGDDPANSSPHGDSMVNPPNNQYVLLRWHYVTAKDCYPQGYEQYSWPSSWGQWQPQWGGQCDASDRRQEEYRNCAEVLILNTDSSEPEPQAYYQDVPYEEEEDVTSTVVVVQQEPEPMDAPIEIFAKDDSVTTESGTPVAVDVTANDVGDNLIVTGTRDGRHGICYVATDNGVVYAADFGFVGQDRCAYVACIEGTNVCDEGWVNVEVLPKAQAQPQPVVSGASMADSFSSGTAYYHGTINAVDDGVVTSVNQAVKVDVVANDEYEGSDSPPIVTEVTNALHGTCELYNNNKVLYTPNQGHEGWDRCTYKACLPMPPSGINDAVCNFARVKVKVVSIIGDAEVPEPVYDEPEPIYQPEPEYDEPEPPELEDMELYSDNSDPVAHPDSVEVHEHHSVLIDVLANDDDPDGDGLAVYSWTSPERGDVEEVDGRLRYTPANGYTGNDSFMYTMCDTTERCSTAQVSVVVTPHEEEEPTEVFAADDFATTTGDEPIVIDVTANDSSSSGEPLVMSTVNKALHGKCELVDKVRYSPPGEDFEGWDRCSYIVCSGDGCDEGRVEVKVLPVEIYDASVNSQVHDRPPRPQRPPRPMSSEPIKVPVEVVEVEPRPVANEPDEPRPAEDEDAYDHSDGPCFDDDEDPDEEEGAGLEKVYAEDEVVVTSSASPIVVDVLSNDFTQPGINLYVTRTGGAENGECKLVGKCKNKVKYTPFEGFVGTDHCGYVVCHDDDVCDEAILAVKVTDQEAAAKKKPMKQQSSAQGSNNDLVVNYDPSGQLSMGVDHDYGHEVDNHENEGTGVNHQQSRIGGDDIVDYGQEIDEDPGVNNQQSRAGGGDIGVDGSAAVIDVDCAKVHNRSRNLRGDRMLQEGDPCVEHSEETAIETTEDGITYATTHRRKPQQASSEFPISSVLRFGRASKGDSYTETVITVPAAADAVIMPGFPDKTFGDVPSMLVSGANSNAGLHETVLRFDTLGVDGSVCDDGFVSDARIRLYALVGSSWGGTFVTSSDDTWSEEEVTWNNAPKSNGIVLGEIKSVEAKTWYEVDVSSALSLGDALGIRILSNEEDVSVAQYASRDHEDEGLKPMLKITCLSLMNRK